MISLRIYCQYSYCYFHVGYNTPGHTLTKPGERGTPRKQCPSSQTMLVLLNPNKQFFYPLALLGKKSSAKLAKSHRFSLENLNSKREDSRKAEKKNIYPSSHITLMVEHLCGGPTSCLESTKNLWPFTLLCCLGMDFYPGAL